MCCWLGVAGASSLLPVKIPVLDSALNPTGGSGGVDESLPVSARPNKLKYAAFFKAPRNCGDYPTGGCHGRPAGVLLVGMGRQMP